MNLTNKDCILKHYHHYLQNNDLLFLFRDSYINSKDKLNTTQKNSKKFIINKSMRNNLFKIILLDSLLHTFINLISGTVGLIYNKRINLINIIHILKNKSIFGLKFEHKFYLTYQLINMKSLNYLSNLKICLLNVNSLSKIFSKLIKIKISRN